MKSIIAIDPGASGGIAWHNVETGRLGCAKSPQTREDAIKFCQAALGSMRTLPTVYLEKVNPFNEGNSSAMFAFGVITERVPAMLAIMGCKIVEVTPKTWQKALNLGASERPPKLKCPPKLSPVEKKQWKADNADAIYAAQRAFDAGTRAWKNKLKDRAAELFPAVDVILATSDALLILHYAQQQEGGQLL